MAENKKSFILYADYITTIDKLSDAKAGKLFKIILNYVNDKNPIVEDLLLQIAFEPIKQQLKRDLVRWDEFKKKQGENGKKGGRPKKPKPDNKNPKNPDLLKNTQKSLTDTVNDTVNDNDTDILLWTKIKKDFLEDGPWQYRFCTEKNIALEKLDELQKEFITDLDLREDFKELKELKNHFTNWFNKDKKNGNKYSGSLKTSKGKFEIAGTGDY